MKKRLSLLTAATFMAMNLLAENVPGLTVLLTSGGTQEYVISELSSIKYNDAVMVIHKKDGTIIETPTTEVSQMTLTNVEATSVSDIKAKSDACTYTIHNLDGKMISKGTLKADEELPVASLPEGQYIININGNTIKVAK